MVKTADKEFSLETNSCYKIYLIHVVLSQCPYKVILFAFVLSRQSPVFQNRLTSNPDSGR